MLRLRCVGFGHKCGSRWSTRGFMPPPPPPAAPHDPLKDRRKVTLKSVQAGTPARLQPAPPARPSGFPGADNSAFLSATGGTKEGAVHSGEVEGLRKVSAETLIPVVPTFFVPWRELQPDLPEYSLDHLKRYFQNSARAVEVISMGTESFVRFHGFDGAFLMAPGCRHGGNKKWMHYQPDPKLAQAYWDVLPDNGKPVDVAGLQARVDIEKFEKEKGGPAFPAFLKKDPTLSLLFFASFQHLFDFTYDASKHQGLVRKAPRGKTFHQTPHVSSPTPVLLNDVMFILKRHMIVEVEKVEKELDPDNLAALKQYHFRGGWNEFASFYPTCLGVTGSAATSNLCLLSREEIRRREKDSKSLEQQLADEMAKPMQNQKAIRKIKRKMLKQSGMELPEPAKLAELVMPFVPETGFKPLKELIESLPEHYRMALPIKQITLFQKYSTLFQLFEHRRPNHWCVARAGVPLPDGVLRSSYTDDELIFLVGRRLDSVPRKALSNSEVQRSIPGGARESIRASYGSVSVLATQYPEYFVVTTPRPDQALGEGSSTITLVKMPPRPPSL